MSILNRLSTLIRSNLNDVIDSMQDPGKEIDQLVLDMEDSARQARAEVAGCIAQEKRLEQQAAALADDARAWEARAVMAVQAGDDALAKEALARKASKESERQEIQRALQEQQVQVESLTQGLKALDARVKDVKLRQGSLREKARAAHGTYGSAVSARTPAFQDFDRMASKVDALEAETGLADELTGRSPASQAAERKLDALATDRKLDDALADLKRKLGG